MHYENDYGDYFETQDDAIDACWQCADNEDTYSDALRESIPRYCKAILHALSEADPVLYGTIIEDAFNLAWNNNGFQEVEDEEDEEESE